MVKWTILIAAYTAGCICLSMRRMEASGTGPKTPRGRLREQGWGLALLALTVSLFRLGKSRGDGRRGAGLRGEAAGPGDRDCRVLPVAGRREAWSLEVGHVDIGRASGCRRRIQRRQEGAKTIIE